ncbi:hypothetical protein [Pseudoalteromonas sp.]|uniref:hypothetical protein n=1 Tax=Pseudoalteromonas sp. TaxID=53249 RepID=UPI0030019144
MQAIDYFQSIKNKRLEELSLDELAYVHLNGSEFNEIKDAYLDSSLPLVINEIRHAKYQRYSQNFLPVAAAFTVLDQLGFCYSRKDIPAYSHANASSIKKSLYYFCNFQENDQDTKTIYALRNSFLHTASILSKAENNNQPSHRFVFDRSALDLIKYPRVAWDGNFYNLKSEMTTFVNPEMFVEMAEEAVHKACNYLYNDNLIVTCKSGEAEFFYRFLKSRAK